MLQSVINCDFINQLIDLIRHNALEFWELGPTKYYLGTNSNMY